MDERKDAHRCQHGIEAGACLICYPPISRIDFDELIENPEKYRPAPVDYVVGEPGPVIVKLPEAERRPFCDGPGLCFWLVILFTFVGGVGVGFAIS